MNPLPAIAALIGAYVAAFVALVLRGWNRDFIVPIAFRYASEDGLNRALGIVFMPLYLLARPFGVRLMGPPHRRLP